MYSLIIIFILYFIESRLLHVNIFLIGCFYNRDIYGMTSRQVRGDWCNSTVIDSHSPDLVTIRIPVNSDTIAQMDSGQCAGQVSRRKQMCVWGGGVRVGVGVGVWARVRLYTLCLFQNVSDPLAGKHTMLHLEVTNLAISISPFSTGNCTHVWRRSRHCKQSPHLVSDLVIC